MVTKEKLDDFRFKAARKNFAKNSDFGKSSDQLHQSEWLLAPHNRATC